MATLNQTALLETVQSLPHLPGVYRYLDESGQVLYVGKAIDLRKRVGSYFQKNDHNPRIALMLKQVTQIETTVVSSESEALLLENNLIKALSPKYNILFRDDKSYPYLMISGHAFPRLSYYRGKIDHHNQYFGPFPHSHAVKESIQLLQKVFQLRTCEDYVFAHRARPCLLHQIKRCSAPCTQKINAQHYQQDVTHAAQFLSGKTKSLIDELSAQMATLAAEWEFEQAAVLRDQIQTLSYLQEKQFILSSTDTQDTDIIACVMAHNLLCVNLAMVRGGRHVGDKHFFPIQSEGYTPAQALEAFLSQHYLGHPIPPLLLCHPEPENVAGLAQWLSEQTGHKISINSHPSGERRVWLEMAKKNATLATLQQSQHSSMQAARLAALIEALDLPDELARIECFDISHTQGEATVASCVVFDQLEMQPKAYRRYNITGVTPGDDYAAMKQVLIRRYRKTVDGIVPDLILIDGGKGQLTAAAAAIEEVGLSTPLLIGVAKGEARKPGEERLIIAMTGNTLQLASDHPGLHLIQQIRDEAHRFAITGHRAKRAKVGLASSLEQIAGIGPQRRQKLLLRFGGLQGVKAASIENLMQIGGISHTLAERIYTALRD